ncbi:MAG TPA: glutaredoxin family protein [Herpetosiphonaceae bacterium]
MADKELVVYGRIAFCPDLARTQRFLQAHDIPYRQINIDEDSAAGARVESWIGHRSVPTVIVAPTGGIEPIEAPQELPAGRSSRSFDRGTLIVEPSDTALEAFLRRHELMV